MQRGGKQRKEGNGETEGREDKEREAVAIKGGHRRDLEGIPAIYAPANPKMMMMMKLPILPCAQKLES